MTTPNLDITRKGWWLVVDPDTGQVSKHANDIEASQNALSHSAKNGGKVVMIDPPAYEVQCPPFLVSPAPAPEPEPVPTPEPQPAPEPVPEPEPNPGYEDDYELPDMPVATNIIRLKPGENNIKDLIKGGEGHVNHVIGTGTETVLDLGYIGRSSFIFENANLKCVRGYKKATFIEGSRGIDSQCWIVNCNAIGRDNSDRSGLDTFTPAFGFDRYFSVGSRFERFMRGVNGCGWAATIRCHYENILEDFWQNGGVIRDVTVNNMGLLHATDQSKHPDVIQCPGRVDVLGLRVTNYMGQCVAMGGTTATGSRFRDVTITGAAGKKLMGRAIGNAVTLENADGKGGPSDVLFEDFHCDKPFFVRGNDAGRPERNWAGENVRLVNSSFGGVAFKDETLNS